MSDLSVADVLERAADLLTPEGVWGNCHCVATAIWQEQPEGIAAIDGEAELAFARYIGERNRLGIYRWNDAPHRTQSEVIAKLREAATHAREQGL